MVIIQGIGVEGDEGIRSAVVVEWWFHFHIEANGMKIPFMRVLPIIFNLNKVSFPIDKLFASIFIQAIIRLIGTTFCQILIP